MTRSVRWPPLAVSVCLGGLLALSARTAPAQQTAMTQQTATTQEAAKFTPFVEETVTYDDNVYRISDQVDPVTSIGHSTRGDAYLTTSLGLLADVPVSLQRFQASLAYNIHRYDHFTELNNEGYDLRGTWLWAVGRNLNGQLGVVDTYALLPFAQVLSTVPTKLHTREGFARGSWLFTPNWKLFGSADWLDQTNSDPLSQFNNVTVDSYEASLSHVIGTTNWLGLDTRYESGHFPVAQPVGAVLVDNDYTQHSFGIVADFGTDTPSHVVARVDQVKREFGQVTQRNLDLTTGRLEYTWTPTGKVAATVLLQRDISPYEYVRSSLVLVKGVTLGPIWHATTTIDVSANLAWLERTYLADPAVTLAGQTEREDQVRTFSALLAYNPATWISVKLSALHETRLSNVQFDDYAANTFWLKVRLSF